ncbi:MAG: YhfC family intramembrane metalloprotease [Oscillospiraceae bacterium]|nr:YhfC family intramembrane metalloprotease [Oscillospiraceae bacterium]
MVSIPSIVCMCIALLLTTLVPIGIMIWYCIRHKDEKVWLAALIGAAGFFVPQMLIRIPILNFLSMSKGFMAFAENHYLIYAIILAATAGLFELAGRFTTAKILDRKGITLHKAMAAGLGHGMIEAVVVVGLQYINNILYAVMINTGTFDAMVQQAAAQAGVDMAQFDMIKETMLNTAAPMYLLGVWERAMTIILHLFLSMLVCYFVAKKRPLTGIFICLAIHTLVDSVAGIGQGLATPYLGEVISMNTMYVLVEGGLTVIAVGCFFGILKLRKKWGTLHE